MYSGGIHPPSAKNLTLSKYDDIYIDIHITPNHYTFLITRVPPLPDFRLFWIHRNANNNTRVSSSPAVIFYLVLFIIVDLTVMSVWDFEVEAMFWPGPSVCLWIIKGLFSYKLESRSSTIKALLNRRLRGGVVFHTTGLAGPSFFWGRGQGMILWKWRRKH